jgi:hypothetical protein
MRQRNKAPRGTKEPKKGKTKKKNKTETTGNREGKSRQTTINKEQKDKRVVDVQQ